ncbi:MAG: SusC/RagA family TonB-linked outer membrane protein [Paludibacteraceae bacterium]
MKLNLNMFRMASLLVMALFAVVVEARTITGTVKDQTGETVISASVIVKGTTIGTVTDFDGNYQIDVPDDAKVLVFSYIGMQTQEVNITGDVINVVLRENSEILEEVVVTGYGTTKKRDLVTSVASVSAEQLKDIPVTNAAEALQGKLAGVSVSSAEGSPDAEVKIRVRGGTSLTQSNEPLYIVDGFPVSSISDIAPSDIASMDVLKDAAATAIYGAQGANGVIIITTKDADTDNEEKPVIHLDYTGYVGWKKLAKTMDVLDNKDFMLMQYENQYLRGNVSDFAEHFIENYASGDTYDIAAMLADANDLETTDWLDRTFGRTGFDSNHSITMSGGNKNANFSLNYTRIDNKAIMQESDYHRNNLSLKSKFKPIKGLTIAFNTRYSDTKVNGAGSNTTKDAGSTSESRLRNAVVYTPIRLYEKDDASLDDEESYGGLYDPITTIIDNYKNKKEMRLNLNGYVSYKFLKHFTLKAEVGYDYKNVHTDRFYGPTTYYARDRVGGGNSAGIVTDELNTKFRQTNTFLWDQKFNNAHNVSLLVGEEILISKGQDVTQTLTGFDGTMSGKDVFNHFGAASGFNSSNYIDPTDNMLSFFARANYDYMSRYYISLTFRADASTRFAKENQWGYFPSAAVAWNIAEESWMENTKDWLSQLKLRFSYGTAGNNNVDLGYLHQDFLTSSFVAGDKSTESWIAGGFKGMLTAGGTSNIAANPNLKWETTVTRNLALDYGFFNQRLSGSLELYMNTTNDLIVKYKLASGYNAQYRNIGSTENKGVEFSVTGVALDKRSKNLHYNLTISANIAANDNRIKSLGAGVDYMEGSTSAFSSSSLNTAEFYIYPGEAIGNIYGYKTDGYYKAGDFASGIGSTSGGTQKYIWRLKDDVVQPHSGLGSAYPGMIKLQDVSGEDGNPDGKIDENDIVLLGNTNPICAGGFSLNFSIGGDKWGQIDLGANFTYSIGNKVLNLNKVDWTTITNNDTKTSYRNSLSTMAYGNRYSMFTEDGVYLPEQILSENGGNFEAMTAALDAANANANMWSPYMGAYVITDYAVEDGSFLRLNQLTLGYSLSDKWISKAYITKCRIYVQVSNLFCLTKYSGFDPEVDVYSSKNPLTPGVDYSAYPRTRGINVGINLSF